MKIIFENGPLALVLETGLEVRRGVPIEVSEELGQRLIEQGGFQRVEESAKKSEEIDHGLSQS